MSWLRIDDQMPINSKIGDLSDAEFRALIALWSHCARKKNGGTFDLDELRFAIFTTPKGPKNVRLPQIARFVELELVSTNDGQFFTINDWAAYQPKDPSAAERVRRFRERNPRAQTGKWNKTRAEVFERDQGVCTECGNESDSWHADHEPPRVVLEEMGESIYDITFIQTLCPSCHARKTRRQSVTTEP